MTEIKKPQDEDWGDYESQSFFEIHKLKIGVGAALAIIIGGYLYSSSQVGIEDAHVDMLKKDYSSAISIANNVAESSKDDYEIADAKALLAKIYSDKSSEFYNPTEAFTLFGEVFRTSPSDSIARSALDMQKIVKAPEKSRVQYLEYLAKKKDNNAALELAKFYSQSDDSRFKSKALKYFMMLPDSAENRLSIAKIYLDQNSSTFNPSEAEKLLIVSSRDGNGEASFLLANINLEHAKYNKFESQKYINKYLELVSQSVLLGYKGEDVETALNVIKYGRYGVPRDPSLVARLEAMYESKAD